MIILGPQGRIMLKMASIELKMDRTGHLVEIRAIRVSLEELIIGLKWMILVMIIIPGAKWIIIITMASGPDSSTVKLGRARHFERS